MVQDTGKGKLVRCVGVFVAFDRNDEYAESLKSQKCATDSNHGLTKWFAMQFIKPFRYNCSTLLNDSMIQELLNQTPIKEHRKI